VIWSAEIDFRFVAVSNPKHQIATDSGSISLRRQSLQSGNQFPHSKGAQYDTLLFLAYRFVVRPVGVRSGKIHLH